MSEQRWTLWRHAGPWSSDTWHVGAPPKGVPVEQVDVVPASNAPLQVGGDAPSIRNSPLIVRDDEGVEHRVLGYVLKADDGIEIVARSTEDFSANDVRKLLPESSLDPEGEQ